jgi:hypothetical protein
MVSISEIVQEVRAMARPRVNDPVGTSDSPICVSEHKRVVELTSEFSRKLGYLGRRYLNMTRALGSDLAFNKSLRQLRNVVANGSKPGSAKTRVHPEIEIFVNFHAQRIAAEHGRSGSPNQDDVERAAARASRLLTVRRGRSRSWILRHHLEGMVALIQETTGTAVLASKELDGSYKPHLVGLSGKGILGIFKALDSTIDESTLARMVLDLRKRRAGRPISFARYFPGWGATMAGDGSLQLLPPYKLVRFEPAFPIYCPN